MTKEEVIYQLESLKSNSQSFITEDSPDVWEKDVKAIDITINSLNDYDKLEKALEMAVRDSDKSGIEWCHECPYDDYDVNLEHCWECGVEYYKRLAGIEVPK